MDNLNNLNLVELGDDQLRRIDGGGRMLGGILGAAIFHVLKEAYNDWDAHKEAFKEGMDAAK